MKAILRKENGKTIGWTLEAENEDEQLIMGTMRNILFFGDEDTAIEYDGYTADEREGRSNYVKQLHWATKGYKKQEDDHQRKRIFKKFQSIPDKTR